MSYSRKRRVFAIYSPHVTSPPAFVNCTPTLADSDSPLRFDIKDYLSDDILDMDFGYLSSEESNFDVYSFGDERSLDFGNLYNLNSDAEITGQSGSHYWCLNPSAEGYVNQFGYQEYTLLDMPGSQFVGSYSLQTEPPYENADAGINDYNSNTNELPINIPTGYTLPSVADLTPWSSFALNTSPSLVAVTAPVTPPTAIPRPGDHVPLPTPSCAAEPLPRGPHEQPMVDKSSDSQWYYIYPTTSVDKGKTQSADYIPPFHPASTGNDVWYYHEPHTTERCGGSFLQTVPGAPQNSDLPDPIASSSEPQRSKKGIKGNENGMQRGEGKQEHELADPLPNDIASSWERTKDRLVCGMLKIYYPRYAGGSIDPERAFASTRHAMEEDLHRSPLAAQAANAKVGGRQSRVREQYLIHILKELRRSKSGEMQNETLMYTQGRRSLTIYLLAELESKLFPINRRRVLRDGHSIKKDSSNTRGRVKHREAEQGRRTAIRHLQNQISAFFLVQGRKKITVGDLLLFIITYLTIGEVAFPGLIRPRFPGRGR